MTEWSSRELASRVDRLVERLELVTQRIAVLETDARYLVEGSGRLEARIIRLERDKADE